MGGRETDRAEEKRNLFDIYFIFQKKKKRKEKERKKERKKGKRKGKEGMKKVRLKEYAENIYFVNEKEKKWIMNSDIIYYE